MVVATRDDVTTDIKELHGFEDFTRRVMREWKVQGLGIAIARGNEIVYARGFGTRDREADLAATPHTLFAIGSTTKSFTSASLALLADEGKFDWDTPIREYLPNFKLWDSVASEHATGRDLASHRTGLPRHDLMWYGSEEGRAELFSRLQHLQPTADFRALWQYQNLMYMTMGYLVEVLSGVTWEEFVRTRIFGPLGMASSHINSSEVENAPDFSRGYKRDGNNVEEMPFYKGFKALAPAGSIYASVTDMGQWMLMHLNNGEIDGRRFLSEGQARLMHTPQMINGRGQYPELPYNNYGFGWMVSPYRGHDFVHHGGNIDGFSSQCALLPDDGVGVVVLTNMDGTPVRDILTYNVLDRFIGGKQVPWNARIRDRYKEMREGEKKGKGKRKSDRVKGTRPSHPLADYAGTYRHPGYGESRITFDGKALSITYNGMTFALRHYHYDIFEATLERFDMTMLLSFGTDKRGAIATLQVPLEATLNDIIFERQPDDAMRDPDLLAHFTGTYEVMGAPLVVELNGTTLHVNLPGMPPQELVPVKGTEFALKSISGVTIEFKRDGDGPANEALVNQMGMLLTARRK
jgi:CubicO group peptidase (beta-lactamase class C family)